MTKKVLFGDDAVDHRLRSLESEQLGRSGVDLFRPQLRNPRRPVRMHEATMSLRRISVPRTADSYRLLVGIEIVFC